MLSSFRIMGVLNGSLSLCALPPVWWNAGSRNFSPMLCPLTLPQLRMLFQSSREEGQGADTLAAQGDRVAKSPLQRTLTAQIMGHRAKHEASVQNIRTVSHKFPVSPLPAKTASGVKESERVDQI